MPTVSFYSDFEKQQAFETRVQSSLAKMVEDQIFQQIRTKAVVLWNKLLPIIEITPQISSIHPYTTGPILESENNYGTFFHYYTQLDFENELFNSLASFNQIEKLIKIPNLPQVTTAAFVESETRKNQSCTVENKTFELQDLLVLCPTLIAGLNEKTLSFFQFDTLILKRSRIKIDQVDTVKFNFFKTIRIEDVEFLSSASDSANITSLRLMFFSGDHLTLKNISSLDTFGDFVTISDLRRAEADQIKVREITGSVINCNSTTAFYLGPIQFESASRHLLQNNCLINRTTSKKL